jgi:hypothetical protein
LAKDGGGEAWLTRVPPRGGCRGEWGQRAVDGHTQLTYWLDNWERLRGAHMWRPDTASRPARS